MCRRLRVFIKTWWNASDRRKLYIWVTAPSCYDSVRAMLQMPSFRGRCRACPIKIVSASYMSSLWQLGVMNLTKLFKWYPDPPDCLLAAHALFPHYLSRRGPDCQICPVGVSVREYWERQIYVWQGPEYIPQTHRPVVRLHRSDGEARLSEGSEVSIPVG